MNEILLVRCSHDFTASRICRSPDLLIFEKNRRRLAAWLFRFDAELTAVGFIHLFFQQAEFPQLEDFN